MKRPVPFGKYHLLDRVPVMTVYGNHDDLPGLAALRNRGDSSAVLLGQGECVLRQGLLKHPARTGGGRPIDAGDHALGVGLAFGDGGAQLDVHHVQGGDGGALGQPVMDGVKGLRQCEIAKAGCDPAHVVDWIEVGPRIVRIGLSTIR